jgi:6-phosphofructokinase 1
MGRDAGHIAISAGIAGGAHVILIPEIPYSIARVCQTLDARQRTGRNFSLIVVAEAVKTETGEPVKFTNSLGQTLYGGIGQYLADRISTCMGAETRVTSLGHLQRGGTPAAFDRLIASAFGVSVVDLIVQGKFDRMVAWQNREVIDVPIADAIAQYRAVELDDTLVKTAVGLGIYVGDLDIAPNGKVSQMPVAIPSIVCA